MLRWKKPKKSVCHCDNCGYNINITPDTVKEKGFGNTLEDAIIATYVECPVCGERILKQLDTPYMKERAEVGAKLEILQKKGKKLTNKQKDRLKSIEIMLYNMRKKLKEKYWDEIYQSLNQYEPEQTEMADQEPTLGIEVTSTEQAGERMDEHVI